MYQGLVKSNPENIEYNLKAAICLLNTSIYKAGALPYLEFVCKDNNNPDSEIFFLLGKAYQYDYKFDKAITAYEKCLQTAKTKLAEEAGRQIETCNNAKELVKYPRDVSFINLGSLVNSEYPDYAPLVPADESFLVFTSRKPKSAIDQREMDGYYPSDIYISTPKNGVWQNAKSIGHQINTRFDEQATDISSDGKIMVVYLDHVDSSGNIYYSTNTTTTNFFTKPITLGTNANSGFETSGTIATDQSFIIFASKRPNGFGETDLYMMKKLPNGNWAFPQILGNQINTRYKEEYPHIGADNKTLYFASQGHSSMGGFDIFKSIYNEETNTWSAVENIGYPINTPDDDMNISYTNDSSYAYLSATRDGGYGDIDLYKIKFNKVKNRYSLISGYITTSDTMGLYVKKQILAINQESKDTLKYTAVKSTGKYVMALTPGKYMLTVFADGYENHNLLITVIDVPFLPEQLQDFQLAKNYKSKH